MLHRADLPVFRRNVRRRRPLEIAINHDYQDREMILSQIMERTHARHAREIQELKADLQRRYEADALLRVAEVRQELQIYCDCYKCWMTTNYGEAGFGLNADDCWQLDPTTNKDVPAHLFLITITSDNDAIPDDLAVFRFYNKQRALHMLLKITHKYNQDGRLYIRMLRFQPGNEYYESIYDYFIQTYGPYAFNPQTHCLHHLAESARFRCLDEKLDSNDFKRRCKRDEPL